MSIYACENSNLSPLLKWVPFIEYKLWLNIVDSKIYKAALPSSNCGSCSNSDHHPQTELGVDSTAPQFHTGIGCKSLKSIMQEYLRVLK